MFLTIQTGINGDSNSIMNNKLEWKTTLESLTKRIFTRQEQENLRKIAEKITKVPDSINIPMEYCVGKDFLKKGRN